MKIYSSENFSVFKMGCYKSESYIIKHKNYCLLVDSGYEKERKRLLKSLADKGITGLEGIIITHSHYDHAGNAAFLQRKFGCPIYISKEGIESALRGIDTGGEGTVFQTKLWIGLLNLLPTAGESDFEKCIDVRDVKELEDLTGEGIRILPTPGHTKDSISVIIEGEIALVGDAIIDIPGISSLIPIAWDGEEALRSWGRLIETGCEAFYPAHGKMLSIDELKKNYKSHRIKP